MRDATRADFSARAIKCLLAFCHAEHFLAQRSITTFAAHCLKKHMFEPVTMTRCAVALAPGKRFPWASRASAATGAGEGSCAGTFKIMAKKIASRTHFCGIIRTPEVELCSYFCSPPPDEYSKRP